MSEALKTDSTLPKKSTSLLARVGPSPGVRVRASHEIWLELALKLYGFESETAALGKTASPWLPMPTLSSRKKGCQGYMSQVC